MSLPSLPRTRRSRRAAVTAVIVTGATLGGLALAQSDGPHGASGFAAFRVPSAPAIGSAPGPSGGHDEPGRRDLVPRGLGSSGRVPDGVTVFNTKVPGVTNLDPALLAALRRAATDAAGDGVEFSVTSGWRSPEYQEQLLRDAIAEYGSEQEAARWVATPAKSAHVSGDAVDIGPAKTESWLSKHGAQYGLCQIYRNEPWHYELRPEAVGHGCPSMYADPTEDPRMK
jgi:hypothetical protein